LRVVSVRAAAELLCEVDLDRTYEGFCGRDIFSEVSLPRVTAKNDDPPLSISIRRPHCTVKVTKSGSVQATSGADVQAEELKWAMKLVARRILVLGHPKVRFKRFEVKQVTACYNVDQLVNLEDLSKNKGAELDWQWGAGKPVVIFEGLLSQAAVDGRGSVLVDGGGLIRLGEAKSVDEVWKMLNIVLPLVKAARSERLSLPPKPLGESRDPARSGASRAPKRAWGQLAGVMEHDDGEDDEVFDAFPNSFVPDDWLRPVAEGGRLGVASTTGARGRRG